MTEQSPSDRLNRASNDIFEATSFLNGTNAQFVEQMYDAWLANPGSVDQSWQAYFSQLGEQSLSPTQLGRGPAWKRDAKKDIPAGDLIAALTGQQPPAAAKPGKGAKPAPAAPAGNTTEAAKASIHAVQMIRAYRMIGHLEADLDPLALTPRPQQTTLDPKHYGFEGANLDIPVFIDGILGLDTGTLAKGAPADLVLFDAGEPYMVESEALHSRARNTAFEGRKFQGRARMTFVGGECVFKR